jgi:predicted transposase/invertase (TIGR01784 family)
MDSGFSYDKVRKVISINIVYFDLGHGTDYVYKGTTDFRGIHTNDILQLSATQKKEFRAIQSVADIFPEYYILKVNGFNDVAKNSLDEWIYFLKNSEIKSEFKAKGLVRAAKELDIMKLSKEERADYESYIEDRRVAESSVKTSWIAGEQAGIEKGIEQGIEKGKIEVALRLIARGMPAEEAAEIAGVDQAALLCVRSGVA